MTLVLDSSGLGGLAADRAKLTSLRDRGLWPPEVPAVVLTESLTGDHRRDFATNRLLRACRIRPVDDGLARVAAGLRGATGRAGTISAVDAIVAAHASSTPDGIVITSDRADLRDLADQATSPFRVVAI